jgi:hypothetical protein
LSVFLLKATVIGGQDVDISMVAKTLDRCQAALKSNCLDDIDFASQYAQLIQKYAIQLEASLQTNDLDHRNGTMGQGAPVPRDDLADESIGQDSASNPYNGVSVSQGFTGLDGDTDMANDVPLWAMDSNVNLLDSGWDNVAFGFEADSLDFLWGFNEHDPQYDLPGL